MRFLAAIAKLGKPAFVIILVLGSASPAACEASLDDLIGFGNSSIKSIQKPQPYQYLFDIYDRFISPVDGERCRMEPGCSFFSREAIGTHGLIRGLLMTMDRLQRCGYDSDKYERLYRGHTELFYDPVPQKGD